MTDKRISDGDVAMTLNAELERFGLGSGAPRGRFDTPKFGSETQDIVSSEETDESDESEDITDLPPELLRHGADTYERKNEDYGASWYEIGEVLYQMAGEEPVTLDSPEDWVRAGLYTRRLDKMFRSFTGEFRGESMNYESVGDAHEDEGVYAHMAAALAMMERADGQRTDG